MSQRSGHLTKEEMQMANKHMKRCSTLYVNRELHLKQRDTTKQLEWLK